MQYLATLLVLPAVVLGLAMPNKVVRDIEAASSPKPNPNPKMWVVDVWPGANCVKGAPTTGPAEPLKGAVGASGCMPLSKTYLSSIVKNPNGCSFKFYDDAGCTVAHAQQPTTAGKCINFTGAPVVAMGVTC